MRALVFVAAALLAGCAIKFELGVYRETPAVASELGKAGAAQASPADTPQPALDVLVQEYRRELDEACRDGVLTREQCGAHRDALLTLVRARITERAAAAEDLERHAEDVEHPGRKPILTALSRALRRMLAR